MNSGAMATGLPVFTIETDSIELRASLVPWDTESFGIPVAQVERIQVRAPRQAEADLRPLADWLAQHGIRLVSCRLDHGCLRESFVLEAVGFRFVEMVYAMQIDIDRESVSAAAVPSLHWRMASQEDLSSLGRIAASAFVTGRWTVDWRVGEGLAGKRYADWVGRSLHDPRHEVLVAVYDDEIAGFFIVEVKHDGSAYWHLTAVAPEFRGRGVGRAMWQTMVGRHAAAGLRSVGTTIAARNIPVVNLYAKLGWRYVSCQMTFHWADPAWERGLT
ncbi:MAG TPA: GNAT family N-acetyltransferase [Rubrivivax sp.]|nr:GNAT family N-acetyltransferase [Rubrivivax sp.]